MAAAFAYDDGRRPAAEFRPAATAIAAVPTVVLIAGATLLVARRTVGAFAHPLSLGLAVVCAAAVAAMLATSRLLRPADDRQSALSDVVLQSAAVLIAAALTFPSGSIAATLGIWLPPIGWALWTVYDRRRSVQRKDAALNDSAGKQRRPTLQMLRYVEADGGETVEGTSSVEFIAGQRTASIHLSFCPPLPSDPVLTCEPADDVDVQTTVAHARTYAARIDVRLPDAAEKPLQSTIRFTARSRLKK